MIPLRLPGDPQAVVDNPWQSLRSGGDEGERGEERERVREIERVREGER